MKNAARHVFSASSTAVILTFVCWLLPVISACAAVDTDGWVGRSRLGDLRRDDRVVVNVDALVTNIVNLQAHMSTNSVAGGEVMEAISAATTAAEEAKQSAEAAQTTADTAHAAATAAQETAGEAKTAAEEAKTTAEAAHTDATAANTAAGGGQWAAGEARSIA